MSKDAIIISGETAEETVLNFSKCIIKHKEEFSEEVIIKAEEYLKLVGEV